MFKPCEKCENSDRCELLYKINEMDEKMEILNKKYMDLLDKMKEKENEHLYLKK